MLPITLENDLVPKEHLQSLTLIADDLQHSYERRQIFRTETEARVSVLDDIHFPTKASKFWQAVREQTVMLDELASLSFLYRRNAINLRRAQKKLETIEDEFDREDLLVDIDECLHRAKGMQLVAVDRVREILLWSKLKQENDDGSFDRNNVDEHQLVSYAQRFALKAANVDPSKLNDGELANLAGQLQTALYHCKKAGVIDKVLSVLPRAQADDLRNQLQLGS